MFSLVGSLWARFSSWTRSLQAGETAPWSRVVSPATMPGGSQLPITSAPGDLTPQAPKGTCTDPQTHNLKQEKSFLSTGYSKITVTEDHVKNRKRQSERRPDICWWFLDVVARDHTFSNQERHDETALRKIILAAMRRPETPRWV